MKVTCPCGNCTSSRICADLADEYQNIAMSRVASKIDEVARGATVDISSIVNDPKKMGTLKMYEAYDVQLIGP